MTSVLKNPEERLRLLVEDFRELGAWSSRFQHLVEMGKVLPSLPVEQRKEVDLVPGCLSKVWLSCSLSGSEIIVSGDAEAVMPRALVALVVHLFSGARVEDIRAMTSDIVQELDLRRNLTPTRLAVVETMTKRVRFFAARCGEVGRESV
jgi:cysteine desulfuration protein SufE